MAKLYKAIDKMDGVVSSFLVVNNRVAVSDWRGSDQEMIAVAKKAIRMLAFQDI